MRFPRNWKSSSVLVLALASVLLLLMVWIAVVPVRTISVSADPPAVAPGGSSIVTVRLLNRLGWTAPFQHRSVTFALEPDDGLATITLNTDPRTATITALRTGDIQISIRVEGEPLPYLVVIHAEHLMAYYRSVSSNAVDASVRESRYFTMIGDETASPCFTANADFVTARVPATNTAPAGI